MAYSVSQIHFYLQNVQDNYTNQFELVTIRSIVQLFFKIPNMKLLKTVAAVNYRKPESLNTNQPYAKCYYIVRCYIAVYINYPFDDW